MHTQDIARPLGQVYSPNPDHVAPALNHAATSRWYGGIKRFADVGLEATDIARTAGASRQVVAGPAIDLLLIATGRSAGFDCLSGPGVSTLAQKLSWLCR